MKEFERVAREELKKDFVRRWGNAQQCESCGFVMTYGKNDKSQTCCGKKMTPVKNYA